MSIVTSPYLYLPNTKRWDCQSLLQTLLSPTKHENYSYFYASYYGMPLWGIYLLMSAASAMIQNSNWLIMLSRYNLVSLCMSNRARYTPATLCVMLGKNRQEYTDWLLFWRWRSGRSYSRQLRWQPCLGRFDRKYLHQRIQSSNVAKR